MSNERQEQIKIFDWLSITPYRKHVFAIPNEGRRSVTMGALMKKAGLRPGCSDIFVAVARKGYHGLFLELKYGKNTARPSQMAFLVDMALQGYATTVQTGADNAINYIADYLGINGI